MQCVYLDVTTEQLGRHGLLQSDVLADHQTQSLHGHYHRVPLQDSGCGDVKQQLIQLTIDECVHWVLSRRKHQVAQLAESARFYTQLWERVRLLTPQLSLFVSHDIDRCYHRQGKHSMFHWNLEGYLRFSAKKLKWTLETLVQDIYQNCREAQEREEFIALLRFCAATQQSLLDDVYITLQMDTFTMVDIWGNDLQQIYLDALPAEEYEDVQMHDLLLSILMTMLPKTIHLFVEWDTLSAEQHPNHQKLLQLLDQIFGDRLCIENSL